MEEPPPTTPQKRHRNLEKEASIKLIPSIPLIRNPKSLYQTNQISKFFYPKYHQCCQTMVPVASEATVTPFDATTLLFMPKPFFSDFRPTGTSPSI